MKVLAFPWLGFQQLQHRFGNTLPPPNTIKVASAHSLIGMFSRHESRVFPMLLEQEMCRAPNVNIRYQHIS